MYKTAMICPNWWLQWYAKTDWCNDLLKHYINICLPAQKIQFNPNYNRNWLYAINQIGMTPKFVHAMYVCVHLPKCTATKSEMFFCARQNIRLTDIQIPTEIIFWISCSVHLGFIYNVHVLINTCTAVSAYSNKYPTLAGCHW